MLAGRDAGKPVRGEQRFAGLWRANQTDADAALDKAIDDVLGRCSDFE
jgi:hypothetical protein